MMLRKEKRMSHTTHPLSISSISLTKVNLTTCENLAPYIKELIKDELQSRKINAAVLIRLWETPTSFAEC